MIEILGGAAIILVFMLLFNTKDDEVTEQQIEDAKLGALLRQMPDGYALQRCDRRWVICKLGPLPYSTWVCLTLEDALMELDHLEKGAPSNE